jgi:hypothetical protein
MENFMLLAGIVLFLLCASAVVFPLMNKQKNAHVFVALGCVGVIISGMWTFGNLKLVIAQRALRPKIPEFQKLYEDTCSKYKNPTNTKLLNGKIIPIELIYQPGMPDKITGIDKRAYSILGSDRVAHNVMEATTLLLRRRIDDLGASYQKDGVTGGGSCMRERYNIYFIDLATKSCVLDTMSAQGTCPSSIQSGEYPMLKISKPELEAFLNSK